MKVVAIGASAGGIEAFRTFFLRMPADSGLAFVVVLHLSAERRSMLTEIIARWTSMAVSEASHDVLVEPNQVYVIPPGHIATIKGGRLQLRPLAPHVLREATPIDEFFDSLAQDCGGDAIGIVLSGTGHDGALGLKAIKACGGLTMAQGTDGSAPQHGGMPASAIATGAVDVIASVEDMPALLPMTQRVEQEIERTELPAGEVDRARMRICGALRNQLGHDFSQYKDKTFLRRVQRRMQVVGLASIGRYAERVEQDRQEATLLFRDLLIGVTTFFRDAAAFEAVERVVVPRLFDGKSATDTVRVWVPGCATGEEAYSIAMLLRERLDSLPVTPRVQVFATDIDDAAIGTARTGRYPATLLSGLSAERRERFFTGTAKSFVVKKELRDLCTFSTHSLVRDPPFSRMDLISCRNLLIYMDADLQSAVIPSFHYSLRSGGVLLLGNSENVMRHENLFAPLEREHRIFVRRQVASPPLRMPPRFAPSRPANGSAAKDGDGQENRTDWQRSLAVASSRVLERYASPFVVVAEDGTVVHYSSRVGQVLQPALGAPSRSLFDMIRSGLRHKTRAALRAAAESGRTVVQEAPADNERHAAMTVVVEPLPGHEPDRPFMIVFKDGGLRGEEAPAGPVAGQTVVAEMERESRDVRERLQSLEAEHETALEELRSSNEELHSVNEELQSSNEELETSKEEIQSVNEELQTVNAQLSTKVDELDRANSDLRNLFESTQVATVFLDQNLVIRAYTPEMCSIYNLIPSDRGRPLTDIMGRVEYPGLKDDVLKVMRTLEPIERRVSRADASAHYLVRILTYRTPDSRIEGSLVTFLNVTRMVQAEEHQRLLVDELNHRVKNMLTVVISLATQTLKRAGSIDEFAVAFMGRVHALTAAYSLLSRESWSSVQLQEIITEELRPYMDGDRANVHLDGPAVPMDARGALALGMAIHELATNAVKYGALSVPEGDVSVTWSVQSDNGEEVLLLDWVERNGPPVTEPTRRGFGSTLIERALGHDLTGEARIHFLPSGVHAHVRAPIRAPERRAGAGLRR